VNTVCRVESPPAKPLLIYDGDCRFCTLWIKRWQQITRDRVDYLPAQDSSIGVRFPELPREQFETAVQLIDPTGAVFSGARAAFGALANNPSWLWLLRCYEGSPLFARLAESGYRLVASNRQPFSWLTRIGWGEHVERPAHFLVRSFFLRALAVIYLVAFASLGTQIIGLAGKNSIVPAEQLITGAKQQVTAANTGWDRYRLLPTLCWFDTSDSFLRIQCLAGAALAVCVIIGIAPALCLFLMWLIYLSLASVCGVFLGFQWDVLLLETGFLAIFFAPNRLWPWGRSANNETPPSRLMLWLLRLLMFKLMFQSGCVKLLSGDVAWHNLTALTVHYETQPLPTWLGWYAHQLPLWFQKTSCLIMFGIELALPFLFFAPRRLRIFAAGAMAFLQVLILLTGNYTFFNWLTLALCIPLLDDFFLAKLIPHRFTSRITHHASRDPAFSRRFVTIPLALIVIPITALQLLGMFRVESSLFAPVIAVHQWIAPFRSVNSYGLFSVMTTSRPEIIVEGSNDGTSWLAYEFKHKPGDVKRCPGFVAPHQPRLDWQMWFAALGTSRQNPWFMNFCARLLEGSPEVLALLDKNPFPDKPPRFIRAALYDYRFMNFAERRATGAWWKREERGLYLPPASFRRGVAQDQ